MRVHCYMRPYFQLFTISKWRVNFARHSSPSSQIFRKLRRTKFDSVLQAENDNDSYGFAVINEQLWNANVEITHA